MISVWLRISLFMLGPVRIFLRQENHSLCSGDPATGCCAASWFSSCRSHFLCPSFLGVLLYFPPETVHVWAVKVRILASVFCLAAMWSSVQRLSGQLFAPELCCFKLVATRYSISVAVLRLFSTCADQVHFLHRFSSRCVWMVAGWSRWYFGVVGLKESRVRGLNCSHTVIFWTCPPGVW
jgi:hypothetical protein